MFKAILFDLDGTLIDPLQGVAGCIQYALERMGRPRPERETLGWCIGPSLRASFPVLLDSEDEDLVEEAIAHYRERYFDTGKFENVVYEGTLDLLAALREREVTLILATNKSQAVAEEIVAHHGLAPFLKAVQGVAPRAPAMADKGEMIAAILREHALDPARTLMVGDRKFDALGAKANAMACAGALYGYGSLEELRQAGADWLIDAPAAVLDLPPDLD